MYKVGDEIILTFKEECTILFQMIKHVWRTITFIKKALVIITLPMLIILLWFGRITGENRYIITGVKDK